MVEVDFRRDYPWTIREFSQHGAPGIDDERVAVADPPFVVAALTPAV